MTESRPRVHGVDSARRVVQLLTLFSESRPTLSVDQMVQLAGIPPASTYRYLALLKELQLVEETSYRTYSLSPRALAIGRAAEAASPLGAMIHPVLSELSAECGEAALLMRRIGDSAIAADVVETAQPVRISFQTGQPMALHRGAGAKLLLAAMGQEWVSGYCSRVRMDGADVEQESLLAETERIQNRGFAESASEVDAGVWAVAAPIRSGARVLAAITVAGPEYRLDRTVATRIRGRVVDAAARINARLNTEAALPGTW